MTVSFYQSVLAKVRTHWSIFFFSVPYKPQTSFSGKYNSPSPHPPKKTNKLETNFIRRIWIKLIFDNSVHWHITLKILGSFLVKVLDHPYNTTIFANFQCTLLNQNLLGIQNTKINKKKWDLRQKMFLLNPF